MIRKSFSSEIFLASLALILLEISYTRIFSFKLFYYFTYLIIGIALLGIGSGGVLVALSRRLRSLSAEILVPASSLLAAAAVPIGYALIATIQLNTGDLTQSGWEVLKLAIICSGLFAPFLLVGVIIAKIFGSQPEQIARLYFFDLVGAGLGCALCVPLLSLISPPGCVAVSGALLALASLRLGGAIRGLRPLAGVLAGGLAIVSALPQLLPDPVPDKVKTMGPQRLGDHRVVYSRWHPVFRVDLVDTSEPGRLYLNHDGMLGSSVLAFDGNVSGLGSRFDTDVRSLPFSLPNREPKVLIIGSAGGHEILASLYFEASQITAVELNPVTVSLLTDRFADFSGRLAEHNKVSIVNHEGRTYLTRNKEKFDLIWFVAPDSYSAMNAATSGAFVLSESYLYTAEMILESLEHLTPDGVLCVQFGEILFESKPNRTARYLATAREALRRMGIDDFASHVLLATTPEFFTMSTILIKRTPFSASEIAGFRAGSAGLEGTRLWHAGSEGPSDGMGHAVNKVISLAPDALERFYAEYPYNITPVSDDSPFFWHFASFRQSLSSDWGVAGPVWDPEDATGERVVITLLAFVTLYSAGFLLLPLWAGRSIWRTIPHKAPAAVYFSALGLGFMFFEVCLIQKLTLFLGYPTYSLTVTLFSLLAFTGIGSLITPRYVGHRDRALSSLLIALFVLMLWYQFGMEWAIDWAIPAPLGVRIAATVLFLAPLGLCMGAFMPIGLKTVSALTTYQQEYVAWAWAINGFFSVMASILATILSMSLGFRWVLLLAWLIYALGVFALRRVPSQASTG